MRTIAAILLLAAAPALFAVTTYEVRSALHTMTVDLEGEGETRVYHVRVVDLVSGALLVSDRLDGSENPTQARLETADRTVRVMASERDAHLTLTLVVRKEGMTLDSISATFLTKSMPGLPPPPPPPARSPPPQPPPPGFEGAYRVGGDVVAPVVISRVEPAFPEEARKARISGIVILEAVIDEQGNVQNARVLKPLPFGLDQAALDAVRQWKFRPGMLEGRPVKVIFNLTINFRLPEVEQQ